MSTMIFWESRCPSCGSVFRDHRCGGKQLELFPTTTYTQLAMFSEERDED